MAPLTSVIDKSIVVAADIKLPSAGPTKSPALGVEFRASGASAQIFFGRSGSSVGSGAIGADSTYVFRVWTTPGFGNPFVIKQDGNVGIGTTSPDKKLEVSGDIKISGGDYNGLFFENASGTTKTLLYQHAGYDALVIKDIVNNADRVTFKNSGNVGIGTTSPDRKLEVDFTGSVFGARFTRSDATGSSTIEFANSAGVKSIIGYDAGVDGYKIGTASATNFVVKQSGNVGIGTTSPGDKLEIGNLTNYTGLTVKGAGASRPAVTFKNVSQSLLGAIYGTENRGMIIETGGNGTNGTVALTLSSAGALKLNTYTAGTLVSDASGNITVSSGGGSGGPYLPLAGGTMTGNINLNDNVFVKFGNQPDFEIGHDASNSYITHSGVGNLIIQNTEDNADIIFKSDDGFGGVTEYFRLDGGSGYSVASKDIRFDDNVKAKFGISNDLQIYHDGSNSYIDNTTNDLYIRSTSDDVIIQAADDVFIYTQGGEDAIIARGDGVVELYYDNTKKLSTGSVSVGTATTIGGTLIDGWKTTTQAKYCKRYDTIATTAYVNNLIGDNTCRFTI